MGFVVNKWVAKGGKKKRGLLYGIEEWGRPTHPLRYTHP
jgi:hypothetical protein